MMMRLAADHRSEERTDRDSGQSGRGSTSSADHGAKPRNARTRTQTKKNGIWSFTSLVFRAFRGCKSECGDASCEPVWDEVLARKSQHRQEKSRNEPTAEGTRSPKELQNEPTAGVGRSLRKITKRTHRGDVSRRLRKMTKRTHRRDVSRWPRKMTKRSHRRDVSR